MELILRYNLVKVTKIALVFIITANTYMTQNLTYKIMIGKCNFTREIF